MPGLVIPGRTTRGLRPQTGFRVNWDSGQATGLTAWLPLLGARDQVERISGKVLTQTGNPTSGYGGGIGYRTAGAPSFLSEPSGIGRCAVSAASNSYIRGTTLSLGSLAAFTMSIWAAANGSDGDMVCAIGTGAAGPRFQYRSVDSVLLVTKGSDGGTIIQDPYGSHNPFWKHFAYSWDGTTNRLYVNGVEATNNTNARDGTGTITRICVFTNSHDSFLTGNTPTGGTGAADMRVYNRPLAPSEVYALYDPSTRWDLCWTPLRSPVFFDMAAAAATFIPAARRFSARTLGA